MAFCCKYKLLQKNSYNTRAAAVISALRLSPAARLASLEPDESYLSVTQNRSIPDYEFADERLHYLLHFCKESRSLDSIQSFHALTVRMGAFARQPIYFTNNVISLYVSLGFTSTARTVFDEMPHRNCVSYNTLINAYGRACMVVEAWSLFNDLWISGCVATEFTFVGVLSCDGLDLSRGRVLHALVVKNGLFFSEYVGTALMGLKGSHGYVYEAVQVFEEMPVRGLESWNSMIVLLGNHGYVEDSVALFQDLRRTGFSISHSTLVGLLSSIGRTKALSLCEQLHCLVTKNGLDCEVMVLNSLLCTYVKCSGVKLAEKLLKTAAFCDAVSYNTVMGALARTDRPERALELLLDSSLKGIMPNEMTYVSLLNCCASLKESKYGGYIHTKVIKRALEADVYVGSALVDFYGKCNILDAAHQCFTEIRDRNVVSWNALMHSYSKNNHGASISLLKEMLCSSGLRPNEYTFSALLKTTLILELKQLHCLTVKLGHCSNEYILSSLITAYARNRVVSDALELVRAFEAQGSTTSSNVIAALYNRAGQYDKSLETLSVVDEPDLISWNILISACSHNGYYSEVFELFKLMQFGNNRPDKYTMVSILCVCTNICSLALGKSVHGVMIKANLDRCDTFVHNILIDMYGKCGSIDDSVKIFYGTPDKNLVTWTALISALGYHGHAGEALERFKEMELHGLKPDGVMLVTLLSACRHGGMVKEGLELFSNMEDLYGVKPEMDHYLGIVDLLSRYGHLKEAEQVISRMPFQPNALIWCSFLAGCKRHKINKLKFWVHDYV